MDESSAKVMRDIDILTDTSVLSGTDAGEPLFVINLCAAMTPQDLTSTSLAGLERYKLYQVSRMEDGRRRYRLRLGFFTTEAAAEDVLASVRKSFATAFTTCLCDEDLKHASGYLNRTVQDLQRTGRFTITKPRVNATTATVSSTANAAAKALAAPPTQLPASKAALPAPAATKPTLARVDNNVNEVIEITWEADDAPMTRPAISKEAVAKQSGVTKNHTAQAKVPTVAAKPHGASKPNIQSTALNKSVAPPAGPKATPPNVPASSAASASNATSNTGMMRRAHVLQTEETAIRERRLSPGINFTGVNTVTIGSFQHSIEPHEDQAAQIILEASVPPASAPKPRVQDTSQGYHVGAGVHIPDTALTFAISTPAPKAAARVSSPIDIAPVSASKTKAAPVEASNTAELLRAREQAQQSPQWREQPGEIPTLDTTQTIRTLTKNELDDKNRDKWFTVQLAISDQPANLDTMPRLDIFEAYTLYSVAVMEGEGIRHALRLGFFREEVSAQAVLGYLKTFFNEPDIVRIADAEYDRFRDSPKAKLPPVKLSAPNKAAVSVVDLEQRRPGSDGTTVPTVNNSVTRNTTTNNPMPRASAPATKRAATNDHVTRKNTGNQQKTSGKAGQQDLLDEAALLGLSETGIQRLSQTGIQRLQKNSSLLSRLVGKLTK